MRREGSDLRMGGIVGPKKAGTVKMHGAEQASQYPEYQIKARLRAAIDAENIPWKELCSRAGLTESEILKAINDPTSPASVDVLGRLAMAMGRDANWILTGECGCEDRFKQSLLEKVLRTVWEYIYKAEVSKDERDPLIQLVKRMVHQLKSNTVEGAYRSGIPNNWKSVAWLHQNLKKRRDQQRDAK